ncbi:HK97 gp10 family phage protein [Sinorhizobium meliloti]|uniref:HK97 gp10 family phage protein n=1 Tax=Rhizobium meliloti TaxID=382 RepID=UPI000FDA20EF|nr:HK97 gp10 family phage protein [Sinorhizobium meliloti]MDE3825858.1 HK97 gp10 family phage protein [Sinorhizobium meliloti]RVH87582.1 HK97 gp10 family phage protein [Sinorhizobium meliloti]RVM22436.1 HK97 gp10 family phage protein [Sinorhizobium meliloti]RVM38431.1 HK97 gp10 family phage protein [Sinorhizobium meliloti]RVN53090.1 HK97 gp10 family phage protein [Sinorhizobium meliloti]
MATLSFSAAVAQWADKVEGAVEAIFKEATQEVVEELQRPVGQGGRMRVDTGFLRASLLASSASMPAISAAKPVEGGTYTPDFGQIEAVIAGADIGDTLYFGYTASYAGYREYGANGQPADGFVRLAAQNWPIIVDRKAAELKARLGL